MQAVAFRAGLAASSRGQACARDSGFGAQTLAPRVNASRRRGSVCICAVTKHSATTLIRAVEAFYENFNKQDLGQVVPMLADNLVFSDRVWQDHDLKGRQKWVQHELEWLRAYPDFHYHVDSILARDDSEIVAAHWTGRGTNKAAFRDLPCTGQSSVLSGVTLFLFDNSDAKIKEIIVYRQANEEEKAAYLVYT